ncbi:hypothetical protein GLOTRDRAFT_57058 [Gloeophyllum trabeum ATCC 11539]|uniref:Uncharacterized protein n=1 Tax=Gloeophyllum trabeum (strain ATCC 11539 / FP-39264 / Madison 617) TaxID=670483 RepID=S7RU63_GLOTA|nr:uncharacterized protein GLOTRDRAFT_57058 [Gloeophyllum trabeum ATCC 11539]EPQ58260.1 hypothetical protein GLOTRDRAFT_57058 [Gloeophyllum trabeum ATCC 11539]
MSGTFTPSPAELALVQKIFAHPDAQKLGALTGEIAVNIFSGSKLPPAVLGEIWSLADRENNGWLSKKGAAIAVRLMGWAQKGETVREDLIYKPGPLPTIEGVSDLVPQATGGSVKPPTAGLPPLTPQDKAKFMRLFVGAGPVNGILSGDKARDILVKSKLPVDKLSQIWSLADTQNRGALDSTDFTIAMYLVQACMSGQLSFIPTSLPPGLYEQAGGRPLDGVATHSTGGSAGSFSPSLTGSFPGRPSAAPTPLRTQDTGIRPQMTGSGLRPSTGGPPLPSRPSAAALGGSAFGTAVQSHGTGQAPQPPWDVTASEKATSDAFFDTLDTDRKGYIEGDVAVPFMLQSQLPEDVLAQVWDLADINNDGRLTRDGFAVAMHLIQGKLAGKEIPATLPLSLIPPSMRTNASPFAIPPSSPPAAEPLRDLLWDDTPPASATTQTPAIQSQRTGPLSPQHTAVATPSYGSPAPTVPRADPFASAGKDLLSDDDDAPAKSPPLADKSAEIGNLQNQLNSTNRSLETTKSERTSVERTLNDQAAQLSALQTQLSSARVAYETETNLLSSLRERYATQTAEIQKTREQLIRAESDLSALRVEKVEIEGNLLRDKEEVRELHRKMHEVGVETDTTKALLEKLKKEAKQQKGLLAIAKKQLVTREHEKEKVDKEVEEARQEVEQAVKEREEIEAKLGAETVDGTVSPKPASSILSDDTLAAAVTQPLPVSPEGGTPITSPTGKSNNPFDRLLSSGGGSRPQSPFLPFTNASVPTPPTASAVADPFGFESEQPNEPSGEAQTQGQENVQPESRFPDIQPYPVASASPTAPSDDLLSPSAETEHWTTPPQSATLPLSSQPIPALEHKADAAGAEPVSQVPSSDANADETDMNTQLKEIEVEDSDSSDEEEPLSKRRESLMDKGKEAVHGAVHPVSDGVGAQPAAPSFDDAFGYIANTPSPVAAVRAASPVPSSPTKDAFGMSAAAPDSHPPVSSGPSGISDFDEALGKLPIKGTNGSTAPFSFDVAFDDNFDFSQASADTTHQATEASTNGSAAPQTDFNTVFMSQSAAPTVPLQPSSAAVGSSSFSFDDAFGSPSNVAPTVNTAGGQAPSNGPQISFDDAFGGVDSKQALAFDKAFGSTSSRGSTSSQPQQGKTAFSSSSPPTSPLRSSSPGPSVDRNTASPPPRSMSPPIRHASPKPRPSTAGSSKDSHEKHKDGPVRHSRLSIRLPFGKKKAKHDAAPPLPSHLSQAPGLTPLEEPEGNTPAVDDDVEAVKQLCGMGFSRTQAVAALEEHGYDVQKALNSLLGSP